MTEPLAHSARQGVLAQAYAEHIRNVTRAAVARAKGMLRHYTPPTDANPQRREMLEIVADASSYHDFGKLDEGFQETLARNRRSANHVRHEDAGAVLLSQYGAMEAAGLVAAHHQGLVRYEFQRLRPRLGQLPSQRLSGATFRIDDQATRTATDRRLEEYRRTHESLGVGRALTHQEGLSRCSGLARRLLLSCLVDADHSDTARHYGQETEGAPPGPRWAERLAALDRYVSTLRERPPSLLRESERLRQELRDELYAACRTADTTPRLRCCDAPVGSGKTTAIMAHLLRVASERRLRHILVVLPYTNIIRQSVETYRRALCLPGEDPEAVVAEHHHQANFKDLDLRGLTTLWRAPIVVTTAVQFFETLASNRPGKLRKLHELPGSAVFVDEAHAALPAELWPVCWNWLREWVNDWNGHLVLASGSLAEFWTNDEFQSIAEGADAGVPNTDAPILVHPLSASLRLKSNQAEQLRIHFERIAEPLTADELCRRVEQSPGPRLVIVNTVQSAAVLARRMQERNTQLVRHISTALAPCDRQRLVEEIKGALSGDSHWTLVATSLVEAGMDFSFCTGFRQRSSVASLIQTGGRVNRNADMTAGGIVWSFDFSPDSRELPNNPAIRGSSAALDQMFDVGLITADKQIDLGRICLDAMRMEFVASQQNSALSLVRSERFAMDYPAVCEQCRVIKSESALVLVDRALALWLRGGGKIPHRELLRRSVQMFHTKVHKLGLEPVLATSDELYVLPEGWRYDAACFGYMAGWLDLEQARIPGGFFV